MFSELVLIFFHDEGFKDVAFLEVPELFERNTAFVAFGNFLYVILEPLQAGHFIFCNDNAIPNDTNLALSVTLPLRTYAPATAPTLEIL